MNRTLYESNGGGGSPEAEETASRKKLACPEMVKARELFAKFLQSVKAQAFCEELVRQGGSIPLFEVTRIEKAGGKVTKQIWLKPDGKIESNASQCRTRTARCNASRFGACTTSAD